MSIRVDQRRNPKDVKRDARALFFETINLMKERPEEFWKEGFVVQPGFSEQNNYIDFQFRQGNFIGTVTFSFKSKKGKTFKKHKDLFSNFVRSVARSVPVSTPPSIYPDCSKCHKEKLEIFYKSKRDRKILCVECFKIAKGQYLAKEMTS